MGLPVITVPKYKLTIPSTNKEVSFRPFLVKEEKILLIAMESDDEEQMTTAIKNIIGNCVDNTLDIESMPMFDIEYIFLQLRSKSKGEMVDMSFECDKCKKQIPVQIDLSTINIQRTEGHTNKIPLSDESCSLSSCGISIAPAVIIIASNGAFCGQPLFPSENFV